MTDAARAGLTWTLIAMIIGSVSLSACAQILLRHGMSSPGVQAALAAGGGPLPVVLAIAGSLGVWAGLALYGLGAMVWLFVLARVEVSVAYAFVALGFLLTMALGCALLGEALTLRKIAGTALVALGVWLVAGRG
jgi:drug/metabolite transporter (DMT)-like permease